MPEWIDEALSQELPLLRDRGEGQHLEFMSVYPQNATELGREIAAFASSNTGTILLGIADDGSLLGIEGLETPKGRDNLCRRIEGVCAGSVRPAITPVVKFAREGDRIVLAIEVPRGTQPVYYSRNTPYVRHLSQSRPAEPHEVVERIVEWLAGNPLSSSPPTESNKFLSALGSALVDILIYGSEFQQRRVNPWLDLVRTQLGADGEELRRLATEDVAREKGIHEKLLSIADRLDAAAAHRLTLGGESWQKLTRYIDDAVAEATEVKAECIDSLGISGGDRQELYGWIKRSSRELADLARRAEALANDGRMQELQTLASQIGRSLLVASYYLENEGLDDTIRELRAVGRALHLIETERLYMDGGQSMRRIIDQVLSLNELLQTLQSKLVT